MELIISDIQTPRCDCGTYLKAKNNILSYCPTCIGRILESCDNELGIPYE